ncbi:MAG: CBS domain-containing protein [Proteobacteria bacterium]|nr:CBS domain-containing protein [Pseudomonadota bacterium]
MTNRPMSEILRNQVPLTLPPEATVQEACRQMHARGVGAVLVTDPQGGLLGIFTGRDAVRMLARAHDPVATPLRHGMTRHPHTLPPGCTAIEALRLMHDGGFRHVPVMRDGVVIGVVSRGDFRGLEQDRLDEETGLWERIG